MQGNGTLQCVGITRHWQCLASPLYVPGAPRVRSTRRTWLPVPASCGSSRLRVATRFRARACPTAHWSPAAGGGGNERHLGQPIARSQSKLDARFQQVFSPHPHGYPLQNMPGSSMTHHRQQATGVPRKVHQNACSSPGAALRPCWFCTLASPVAEPWSMEP